MNTVSKEIVEFNEFENKLQEFKDKYDGVVYDLTIHEQEKQARTDRLSIGKVISKLDSKHKELKAPLKDKVDLIDGRRKEIKDQLLEVQEKIKSQIKAHEDKIKEHEEKLQFRIDEITDLIVFKDDDLYERPFNPKSAQVKQRLTILENITVDDSFEDRKADATLAKVDVHKKLHDLLIERFKFEDEQAELEKIRKEKEERERTEREDKIRKEAADKATREADEKALREKQRVAMDKVVAEEKVNFEKENLVRSMEKKSKLENLNMLRIAEEQAWEKLIKEQEKEREESLNVKEAQANKDNIEREKQEEGSPRIIYLQAEDGFVGDQITWSSDKINETDIKYILYTEYEKLEHYDPYDQEFCFNSD